MICSNWLVVGHLYSEPLTTTKCASILSFRALYNKTWSTEKHMHTHTHIHMHARTRTDTHIHTHRWQLSLAPGRTQEVYAMQQSASSPKPPAPHIQEGSEEGACEGVGGPGMGGCCASGARGSTQAVVSSLAGGFDGGGGSGFGGMLVCLV